MAATLASLRAEVLERGADYFTSNVDLQRVNAWINNAYLDICGREPWPFLEVTLQNVQAPYTFTDLRGVLSVVDLATMLPLEGIDRRDLSKTFANLQVSGFASYWYLEGSATGDTLKLFNANSDNLEIRYVKSPPPLGSDTDIPLLPDRFTYTIVDGTMAYVHRDNDDYDLAGSVTNVFEQGIQRMTDELLYRNWMNAQRQFITRSAYEYDA